jgi:hypothetical protein
MPPAVSNVVSPARDAAHSRVKDVLEVGAGTRAQNAVDARFDAPLDASDLFNHTTLCC